MNVGIIGASGYTGLELLRLLAHHPKVQVACVSSRKDSGKNLVDVFPSLQGYANYDSLVFQHLDINSLPANIDLYFCAVPHGAAMELVPALLKSGSKVIDLSADFRLKEQKVFEKWYQAHTASSFLEEAVYGLPELYSEKIKQARLIANPGCYTTSAILALAPFVKKHFAENSNTIIIDSKSGVSGAGRSASLATAFCETYDNFSIYKATEHRHIPEIEQELSSLATSPVTISFTPHLVPMNRGILSTCYITLNKEYTLDYFWQLYKDFYADAPFIRLKKLGQEPKTADVRATNYCDIALFYDKRTNILKIVSVIDNVCRGASGQAICNMNIMFGWTLEAGLSPVALRP